jgi:hypothetical protein
VSMFIILRREIGNTAKPLETRKSSETIRLAAIIENH